MNLLPLLAALVPWAPSPLGAFVSIYAACAVLCLELQVATFTGWATLPRLVPFNLALATLLVAWRLRRGDRLFAWAPAVRAVVPAGAVLPLAAAVVVLNVQLPFEAADPYQMERVVQIERLGTLAYDPEADPKVNIATGFYELLVADVRQAPLGAYAVRLHGVASLALYLIALASVAPWLPAARSVWGRAMPLVVPVVFHQFVLIKNDLFLGLPALVALAWLVSDAAAADPRHAGLAGWLVGLAVGAKVAHAPLAGVLAVGLLLRHPRRFALVASLAAGGIAGGLCSGLVWTGFQNTRVYGHPLAPAQMADMGNTHPSTWARLVGGARFAISMFDLEQLTTRWWPGRGGWGGTFGIPAIWALLSLGSRARHEALARRVAAVTGASFLLFALAFPDADISQRIVLGPGVLLILAAIATAAWTPHRWDARVMPVVVLASGLQLARSVALYLTRGPVG